jgi:hypothetical protein
MTKLMVTFRIFANAPKNAQIIHPMAEIESMTGHRFKTVALTTLNVQLVHRTSYSLRTVRLTQ